MSDEQPQPSAQPEHDDAKRLIDDTVFTNVSGSTDLSTVDGGKTPQSVDRGSSAAEPTMAGVDIARAALTEAQRMARGRRGTEMARREQQRRSRTRRDNTRRGGYSGTAPDERDPQPVRSIIERLFAERGWTQEVAEARVFAEWPRLVGTDLAAHCAPVSLRDGELRVAATSTAWATQLRILSGSMLGRLTGQLGAGVVTRIQISGPVGPTWKRGAWSVRGRGPRDTYG